LFNEAQRKRIIGIWESYARSERKVVGAKGNTIPDFDGQRRTAIPTLQELLNKYRNGDSDLSQFKSSVDSFNKRNNLWGFTATKGQMFFNQLVKAGSSDLESLDHLLKSALAIPKNLDDALAKIDALAGFCDGFFSRAADKRTVPNPGSVCYFLSYFWQLQDHIAWPIMYTSLIEAFVAIEIWEPSESPRTGYESFYRINDSIEQLIHENEGYQPSHWEIEHAFWDFFRLQRAPYAASQQIPQRPSTPIPEPEPPHSLTAESSISISDYLIPKIARLVELGAATEQSGTKKGFLFEQMTAEAFNLLDFETTNLGQGTGRNPDFIAKSREENTAFIVDAKAYSQGYSLGRDDRAMREYINAHCPKLRTDGYKKIGFIVVSNSFRTDLEELATELTWETDIKRFILLETEALLYLLAYKTKNRLRVSDIIYCLVSLGNPIGKVDVIGKFDDW
jgi:hypothetical protein